MFIVFDLDDTLANTDHRQHILAQDFENESDKWNAFFDACIKDEPMKETISLFNSLASSQPGKYIEQHRVEIWTGRSERVKKETEMWLTYYIEQFSSIRTFLRMRTEGDFREDWEIKTEWIEKYGKPDLTFDDRNKVVKWWREQGVTCCQVKESDF